MSDWEEYNPRVEVTSSFTALSFDIDKWITQIQQSFGWNVSDIDQEGDGTYVVKAEGPTPGDETETRDKNLNNALAFLFSRINRMMAARIPNVEMPNAVMAKFAAWEEKTFSERIEEIAHEYADAKVYDKKAASAWMELARDNKRRADMIRQQITVEVTDNPLPYKTFNDMVEDVISKKKFIVSRANTDHPIWNSNQVVDFRIVHDILGHVAAGADWSWFGMNRAFSAHAPLLSTESQKALFVEILGKGAFNAYYRSIAQPKIAFLKCFEEQQKIENKPSHRETHPSQSPVPTEIAKMSSAVILIDPNEGFESGVEPDDYNAFMYHKIINDNGEAVDPLNSPALMDVIHNLDPRWDQHPDDEYLKHAIGNAFAVSLIGRGRNPKDTAMLYQAIHHIPATISDPLRYFDAINADRNAHNLARGYGEVGRELDSFMPALMEIIKVINPHLVGEDLHSHARRSLFDMRAEEENEARSKFGPNGSPEDVAREAMKRIIKRLNAITKTNVKDDQDFHIGKHEDSAIYPSPLASDIKALAEIAENMDEIVQFAKEDLDKGGRGHHFRNNILQKKIKGLGPNEISEVWFYISPHHSQLGILNPSIIKSLGIKVEDLGHRDYFKAERQLQCGRDACGYNHMPLGQFSFGLDNIINHDYGHYPDRSYQHILHPTKYYHIDWDQRAPQREKPIIPGWWADMKPYRLEVGKNWDKEEGFSFHRDSIPFKQGSNNAGPQIPSPSFNHPDTDEVLFGRPGQSGMSHIIDALQLHDQGPLAVWNQDLELRKEAEDANT